MKNKGFVFLAVMLKDYKLLDNSEYCQSWGDPREKKVEHEQTAAYSASQNISQNIMNKSMQPVSDNIQTFGESLSDAAQSFGGAVSDGVSALGGLFDLQPSQTEEPQPLLPKKKRGRGQGI